MRALSAGDTNLWPDMVAVAAALRWRLVLGLAVARAARESRDTAATAAHENHGRRGGVRRVACAVVGETRTLPVTVGSLLRNVVRPLHADVFLHLSAESTLAPWQRPAAADFPPPAVVSAQQMDRLRLALRPVRYATQQVPTQFQRWKLAFEAIEAHEAAAGWRYDWVVRVRPDLVFGCSLSRRFLHVLAHRVWMYWDFAAVLPRSVAAVAFKRAADAPECGVRMEYCEPRGLLRAKNATEEVWSPASAGDYPSIYRHARCPDGKAHFLCHRDEQQRLLNSTRPACGAIRETNLRADWCCPIVAAGKLQGDGDTRGFYKVPAAG